MATLNNWPVVSQVRARAYRPENHHFGAVGPMTGVTTISQPVMVVANKAFGNRAYCTLNEGLGKVMRFGCMTGIFCPIVSAGMPGPSVQLYYSWARSL